MDEPTRAAVNFCVLPQLTGIGGPASFQGRLITGLRTLGYEVTGDPHSPRVTSILVIGAPVRRIGELLRAKRNGVRIVQRLNGMNWLHRRRRSSLQYFLRSEWNNWMLAFIRRRLADRIVYQSHFARSWWESVYGPLNKPTRIVYNAVDLNCFTPEGVFQRPQDHFRLLLVEGRMGGGYELGLEHAIRMVQRLNLQLSQPVEVMVVGEVPERIRSYWEKNAGVWLTWAGRVDPEHIPGMDRSAHLLFSADLNAACPNSVVEAMACGLPVIGFATGALPEMVSDGAGLVVPYGGNYWNLEPADIGALAAAARTVLAEQSHYRISARKRAEAAFGLDRMLAEYLKVLL